jgi:TRAP-type C4-dicarboxylate transport system substrate-binding protein
MLKMNAIFMPCVALASGRVWQQLPDADRELISRLTKSALDEQIDATVANESELLEEFGRLSRSRMSKLPMPVRSSGL